MNKSALLTILSATVLSGIKKQGSNSKPINTMLKVGGVSDGLIHIQAEIIYNPLADWRNQAGVEEFFFDLHKHINPAIKLLKQLKKEIKGVEDPNILEFAEGIADSQSVKLWYYSWTSGFFPDLMDDPENLPLTPLNMIDVSHIKSKKYTQWDLTEMMASDRADYAMDMLESAIGDQPDDIKGWLEEEGFEWIYDVVNNEDIEKLRIEIDMGIDEGSSEKVRKELKEHFNYNYDWESWQYEEELDSLMELHKMVINFTYDPSTVPVEDLKYGIFESEIKQLLLLALNLYHGSRRVGRNGLDDIRLGEIRNITIKPVILESSSKSQLRRF